MPFEESKAEQDQVSASVARAEIGMYWRLLSKFDWPSVDPQVARDSPFSKLVCTPNVVWFLLTEDFFPKTKLFDKLDKVPAEIIRGLEDGHLKASGRFLEALSELAGGEPRPRYGHFAPGLASRVD